MAPSTWVLLNDMRVFLGGTADLRSNALDSGALAATLKQKHRGIVWNAQILGLVGAGCLVFSKFEEIVIS